ncbi:MAG: DUF3524 domain-containing protein [Mariniblastus sp.]
MNRPLRVLSLQPYFGGSHLQFLNGWMEKSRHQWTVLELPAKHWKWRMRHSAIHFSQQIAQLQNDNAEAEWDVIFCSDMMNVTELKGMLPKSVRDTPIVLYFHENQFEYPTQHKHQRDNHLSFTNFISAVSADQIWFNSRFNFDSMMNGLKKQTKHWPDYVPDALIDSFESKMQVHAPGIDDVPFSDAERNAFTQARQSRSTKGAPLRLVWAARWEYDKNPQGLLDALILLDQQSVEFEISVVGQTFGKTPDPFQKLQQLFPTKILRWGFQKSRNEYWKALAEADIFVSTANHEFFGLSPAEGIVAGAWPLFPDRLAYPELLRLATKDPSELANFLYDGTPQGLCDRIVEIKNLRSELDCTTVSSLRKRMLENVGWNTRAKLMDSGLDSVVDSNGGD